MTLPNIFATMPAGNVAASKLDANFTYLANAQSVNVTTFSGVDPTGAADSTVGIQAAITASANKALYFPAGTYKILSALTIANPTMLYGDGASTTNITTPNNIEMANASGNPFGVIIRDINFANTFSVSTVSGITFTATAASGSSALTSASSIAGLQNGMGISGTYIPANSYIQSIVGATVNIANASGVLVNATGNGSITVTPSYSQGQTNFHIHAKDVSFWKIQDCWFNTVFNDLDYGPTNHAGVWFDRTTESAYSGNFIENSWLNHAQVLIGTSDSGIRNSTVWADPFDYSVKLAASETIVTSNQISAGVGYGGIWITQSGTESNGASNHLIVGNNIDGGGVWFTGYGIYANQPLGGTITGNRINQTYKAGIYMVDAVAVSVTGNLFLDTNKNGNSFSDVEIAGSAFGSSGVNITGNTHFQSAAKTPTAGYAIREITSGAYAAKNMTYTGNSISGTSYYQSPTILVQSTNQTVMANSGAIGINNTLPYGSTVGETNTSSGLCNLSTSGVVTASTGTLSLTIPISTYVGSVGGFAGTLYVSNTRTNSFSNNTYSVYSVTGYGTTATFTQTNSTNGSGGGASFALAMSADGVITMTNTFGYNTDATLAFVGIVGLGE